MAALFTTVATIVAHTPIWVWVLYALLLFLGFQRTRDSAMPLARLLPLPLVVAGLAIASVVGAGSAGLLALVLGAVGGGVAGWHLERDGATRRLPDGRIWLRGEWWSFAQLVAVLLFRYAINVVAAMEPALAANPAWRFGTLFVSAALSALFLGRLAARLRVYFAGERAAA